MDRGECARQELFSERIASVGKTVLGYVYWLAIWFQFYECLVNRLRMKFPADIGAAFIWIFIKTSVDDISVVVIESDEVLVVFYPVEEPAIPKIVREYFECSIDKCIFSEFE